LYFPWNPNFAAGLWLGAVLGMSIAIWDEIPEAIENWRRGAAGERLTEKALVGLGHVRHDVTLGWGNVDHILVNDRGVFVIGQPSRARS
jgi:hypothetical protein